MIDISLTFDVSAVTSKLVFDILVEDLAEVDCTVSCYDEKMIVQFTKDTNDFHEAYKLAMTDLCSIFGQDFLYQPVTVKIWE